MPPSAPSLPRLILAAALAAVLSGCSGLDVVEAVLLSDEFTVTEGVSYGPAERQRLDVYSPRAADGPAPVVVFVHGGSWQEGSKDQYRLLGDRLARRGMVTVVPDYRLYPEVLFPAWVEDAAEAVAWARANAARYGGDPEHVVVVGHSAGAHTVTLLAVDPAWLRGAGLPEGAVRGYASLAGPVDVTWTDPDIQTLMGPREEWAETYPITHADGSAPPLLFMHGADDRIVAPGNSTRLAGRLEQLGGCAEARLYPDVDHLEIVVGLMVPWLGRGPLLDDLVAFVRDPDGICLDG